MIHFTKNYLPPEHLDAPIQVGSKVMIVDGSYTITIVPKVGIKRDFYPGTSNDIWTVIEINVACPTDKSTNNSLRVHNNCIIMNHDGIIVFCSRINIRNIKHIGEPEPEISNPYMIVRKEA